MPSKKHFKIRVIFATQRLRDQSSLDTPQRQIRDKQLLRTRSMQWLQCRLLQELCPSLGRFSCKNRIKRCWSSSSGLQSCASVLVMLVSIKPPANPPDTISSHHLQWKSLAKCLDPSDDRNTKTT